MLDLIPISQILMGIAIFIPLVAIVLSDRLKNKNPELSEKVYKFFKISFCSTWIFAAMIYYMMVENSGMHNKMISMNLENACRDIIKQEMIRGIPADNQSNVVFVEKIKIIEPIAYWGFSSCVNGETTRCQNFIRKYIETEVSKTLGSAALKVDFNKVTPTINDITSTVKKHL